MTKRKSKGAYMISSVAEMYGIHPQTLRLYEREGLLKPSRTEGNTRLYTDEDLQRLEFIPLAGARSGREHQRHRYHSSDARAHGRNAGPDSRLRKVHPGGSAVAGNGGGRPAKGAIVPVRRTCSARYRQPENDSP
jgi:hypothetical protein